MSFSISDTFVEFVSAFQDRYDFPTLGEGDFHCLVTNKLRKKNSYKDISERTNSFEEIEANWIIGN